MRAQILNMLDLTAEIQFASSVAREAATIVNTFYVGSSEVRYKSHNEPVTEADRSANLHIVSRIQAEFPEDGILSEESKDNLMRLHKERVWIIDPLDGTKEFIARNGEFSIMIGLAIGGKANGTSYDAAYALRQIIFDLRRHGFGITTRPLIQLTRQLINGLHRVDGQDGFDFTKQRIVRAAIEVWLLRH